MIVIVDTGVANRYSVRNALEHVGADVRVSANPEIISQADRLVFPGVGAFSPAMESIRNKNLIGVLTDEVMNKRTPILGICLGYQMMAERSFEDGECFGLGWIPGNVLPLEQSSRLNLPIPHIGFNTVKKNLSDCQLFRGLPAQSDFYFVHSFYLATNDNIVAGTTDYGKEFTSAIEVENIMGCQFHPEKSQDSGLQVLKNFLDWTPVSA